MDSKAFFHSQKFGILIVLSCGIMWGISGILGQYVFDASSLTATHLTIIRLFLSGVVLLFFSFCRKGKKTLSVWKKPKDLFSLIFFAITGLMGVQFTYFKSIEFSNAATGTVIQYTYIIMLLFYTTFILHVKPKNYEAISVICSFVGIFLIATHGSFHSLAISGQTLAWGQLSALCFCIYCLYPQKLYDQYDLITVIGWSSLIGSIFLAILTRTSSIPAMKPSVLLAAIGVAFVGTLIPFVIYGIGIGILGSVKASLFVTVEPISSAILTWLVFGTKFTLPDILGFLLILGSIELVALLTFRDEKREQKAHDMLSESCKA